MKELITKEQLDMVLRVIAIAFPITGAVTGVAVGAVRKRLFANAVFGLILGSIGTVVFVLWRVYNWSGSRYGYTSVVNLLIQFILCLVLGIVAGIITQKAFRSPEGLIKRLEKRISTQEEKLNAS